MTRRLPWVALIALLHLACSRSPEEPPAERGLPRRVFSPAPERVLAVAPHNIHKAGMGPYKLGASLEEVLNLLPQFPPVELLKHRGWFDYSLVRPEGGSMGVGVGPTTGVEFVVALGKDVARTENGIGVEMTKVKLAEALGGPERSFQVVRDARVLRFPAMPQTRFVAFGGHVKGIILGGQAAPEGKARPSCKGSEDLDVESVRVASKLAAPQVSGLCVQGQRGALARHRSRLALLVREGDKWKRLAAIQLAGLVFAGPIDVDGDGDHEVAAVSVIRDTERIVARVRIVSWNGSRWDAEADLIPYRLGGSTAEWTGPPISDIELLLEVTARDRVVSVGGLYVELGERELRNIVPLEPVTLSLPERKKEQQETKN